MFSTHEFVQEADTTKTVVSEFLSSGVLSCLLGFGVVCPSFSELQVLEFQISELQVSELQISEFQIPEFQISEFRTSEFQVLESLVSEFLRSGTPTSQLTSFIDQEAVELANATKTVVSEFLSSGVLAFSVSELCTPDFRSS